MSYARPLLGGSAQHGSAGRSARRDDVHSPSPLRRMSREQRTGHEPHVPSSSAGSQQGSCSSSSGTPMPGRQHRGSATREGPQRGHSSHTALPPHSRSSAGGAATSSASHALQALPHLVHPGPVSASHAIEPVTRHNVESGAGIAPQLSLPSLPAASLHNNNHHHHTTSSATTAVMMMITPRRRSSRGREAAVTPGAFRHLRQALQPAMTSENAHHGGRAMDASETGTQHSAGRRHMALQSAALGATPASPRPQQPGTRHSPLLLLHPGDASRNSNLARPMQLSPCVALPTASPSRTRMTSATTQSPLPHTRQRPSKPIGTVMRRPDPPPPPPPAAAVAPGKQLAASRGAVPRTHRSTSVGTEQDTVRPVGNARVPAAEAARGTSWPPRWFIAAAGAEEGVGCCRAATPEERDYAVRQELDALFDAMTHDLAAAEPADARRWMLRWFTDLQQRQQQSAKHGGAVEGVAGHAQPQQQKRRLSDTWHARDTDRRASPQATESAAPHVSNGCPQPARLSLTVSSLSTSGSGASSVRRAEQDGATPSLLVPRPPSASARQDSAQAPDAPLPYTHHHRPPPPAQQQQQPPQQQQQPPPSQPAPRSNRHGTTPTLTERSALGGGTAKESLTSAARGHMPTSASVASRPLPHGVRTTLSGVFAAPSHA